MGFCGDCWVLEDRLSEASEQYGDLIVQQNRVMRDNDREASGLEDAIREARSRRTSVARDLLSHRRIHGHSHAKTQATAQDSYGMTASPEQKVSAEMVRKDGK